MSSLRLLLICFVLAVGQPAQALDLCTPLPDAEVSVELSADIADPVVGDSVEFSARVRDAKRVLVRNITIELSGWQTRFVQPGIIEFPEGNGDPPFPFPDLNFNAFAMGRIAAYPGPADIRFAVTYEVARGCAETPYFESRTARSLPLTVDVIAANACRGDCDNDKHVTTDEIQRLIIAALEGSNGDSCATAYDPDRTVGVDDLLRATTNALVGCPAPRVCGGIDRITCPGREWCDFPAGSCGVDAAEGTCRTRGRDLCYIVLDEGGAPLATEVCGCDGVTYGDDCQRAAAGVALSRNGPCEKSEL